MKKRLLLFIVFIIVCIAISCSLFASAITPLDPDAEVELTLNYQKDGTAFADLTVNIYRVAKANADGTFELIDPFYYYPINIHDVMRQEQWTNIASTLNSYIVADKLDPDKTVQTNSEGRAQFTGLQTGLYFVQEVVAENAVGTYVFNQFMVYLPTPQPDGSFDYSVEANPKCTEFVPKTQYTVNKLWQDAGRQDDRPKEITVDIYKDGKLQESQVLNADKNWSYTWYVSGDDYGKWTVVERSVAEPYKVTVQQNGNTFSIINTCQTATDSPQTGNTFTPLPWILGMCLSGIMMLILGVYDRRHR